MDLSTCVFWCAVALGAVVRGSPIPTVSVVLVGCGVPTKRLPEWDAWDLVPDTCLSMLMCCSLAERDAQSSLLSAKTVWSL